MSSTTYPSFLPSFDELTSASRAPLDPSSSNSPNLHLHLFPLLARNANLHLPRRSWARKKEEQLEARAKGAAVERTERRREMRLRFWMMMMRRRRRMKWRCSRVLGMGKGRGKLQVRRVSLHPSVPLRRPRTFEADRFGPNPLHSRSESSS